MARQLTVDARCPECGSPDILEDEDVGELVCNNCGLVVSDDMLDLGPEWRAFTKEEGESRSRVGLPTFYFVHDKGLSTSISRIDRDASGRKLPLSTRQQMWRLRKWQIRSRVHSSIDRNLTRAMTELSRLCDKVSIPAPIKEEAAVIYRKALDEGLVRGRSIAALVAASLYAACRKTGTPRNLIEIAEATLVSRKDVARCYRLLLRKLNLRMPIPYPFTYLSKIAERADIPGHIQSIAAEVLNEAKQKHVSAGKNPRGLAAAALYIACIKADEKKTQKDVADAAGVTEVTVRNRYKTLKEQLSLDLMD